MTMAAKRRRQYRTSPKGKKREEPESIQQLSRCIKCKSTSRIPYFGKRREITLIGYQCDRCQTRFSTIEGTDCDCGGRYVLPFTKIVWRRTQCTECNQYRVDRSFES